MLAKVMALHKAMTKLVSSPGDVTDANVNERIMKTSLN
jgi:hypothetical protein